VAALTEMYIQSIDSEGQGDQRGALQHSFSASAISEFNKKLDEELGRFARREWTANIPT